MIAKSSDAARDGGRRGEVLAAAASRRARSLTCASAARRSRSLRSERTGAPTKRSAPGTWRCTARTRRCSLRGTTARGREQRGCRHPRSLRTNTARTSPRRRPRRSRGRCGTRETREARAARRYSIVVSMRGSALRSGRFFKDSLHRESRRPVDGGVAWEDDGNEPAAAGFALVPRDPSSPNDRLRPRSSRPVVLRGGTRSIRRVSHDWPSELHIVRADPTAVGLHDGPRCGQRRRGDLRRRDGRHPQFQPPR